MIRPSHLNRLDRYWAGLIGCKPELLQTKSHVVFVSQTFPGVAAFHKDAWIIALSPSVKRDIGETLLAILESKVPSAEIEKSCTVMLASVGHRDVVGPSALQYLSSRTVPAATTAGLYSSRQLFEQDDALVTEFLSKLMAYREYTVLDRLTFPYLLGVFNRHEIIAMGAVRLWDSFIGEVFLDTLPQYAGKGIAVRVGRQLVKWIFEQPNEMIAQYDTEVSNVRSMRVAEKLGFIPYATLLMTNVG